MPENISEGNGELKVKFGSFGEAMPKENPASFRYLPKRQKRRLMACEISNCFHPAKTGLVIGGRTLWYCHCHDPVNPEACREDVEREERKSFLNSSDCVFCGATHATNPVHGLEGRVTFVCDKCYLTPISELRKYYR